MNLQLFTINSHLNIRYIHNSYLHTNIKRMQSERGGGGADAEDREGGGADVVRGPGQEDLPPVHRQHRHRHPLLRQVQLRLRRVPRHQVPRAVQAQAGRGNVVLRQEVPPLPPREPRQAHDVAAGRGAARRRSVSGPLRAVRQGHRHQGAALRRQEHGGLRGQVAEGALPQVHRLALNFFLFSVGLFEFALFFCFLLTYQTTVNFFFKYFAPKLNFLNKVFPFKTRCTVTNFYHCILTFCRIIINKQNGATNDAELLAGSQLSLGGATEQDEAAEAGFEGEFARQRRLLQPEPVPLQ